MPIIFTHIKKTAGRSISRLFAESLGEDRAVEIYPGECDLWDYFQKRRRGRIGFVGGHVDFGCHALLGFEQAEYIVFLREPTQRIISEYFHFLRKSRQNDMRALAREVGSLDAWFRDPQRPRNLQLHRVCGGVVPKDVTHAAQNLREGFAFVGIFEQMERSLELLASQYRLDPRNARRENAGRYRGLAPEEVAALRDRHRGEDPLDYELYDAALALFEERATQAASRREAG